MSPTKEISDQYLVRYRKTIHFANIALAIALVLLIVNWLFAVEQGYQDILYSRKLYKAQLKEAEKKLKAYRQRFDFYYNRYNKDSIKNLKNTTNVEIFKKSLLKQPGNRFLIDTIESL